MSRTTGIEWTDMTWNPMAGCTRISAGCDNCYAIRQVHRMGHNPNTKVREANTGLTRHKESRAALDWSGEVRCLPERLAMPLRLKKPQRIFVNSLSDLFHEQAPDEFIDQVFAVMAEAQHSTFQILTKRPERMEAYFADDILADRITDAWIELAKDVAEETDRSTWQIRLPLKNVWLGVSVEDQKTADERIPLLLQTPAAVRFLSCEPLLGRVDLSPYLMRACLQCEGTASVPVPGGGKSCPRCFDNGQFTDPDQVSWVIVGGESGPGARPMHPAWVRSIRDQCQAAGVPFFFKQNGNWLHESQQGEAYAAGMHALAIGKQTHVWPDGSISAHVGKKAAGRLLDGREWQEFPSVHKNNPILATAKGADHGSKRNHARQSAK